jgi:superfamily I DNA and/or RNA helicase
VIKEEYKYLTRETDGKKTVEERLRIGTVDSFQGMEFDVVFLSMVRYRQILRREKEDASDYRRLQTNTFGHLVSENRLCVSMSRQKKVLVVVGDAALAQSEIGRDAVPALAAFCDLCKTEGKFRDS